jgi:hypothetical protein
MGGTKRVEAGRFCRNNHATNSKAETLLIVLTGLAGPTDPTARIGRGIRIAATSLTGPSSIISLHGDVTPVLAYTTSQYRNIQRTTTIVMMQNAQVDGKAFLVPSRPVARLLECGSAGVGMRE